MPQKTRRSQRKRAAILRAAMDEFPARGFRDTSMDQIAAVAQVSKRTIYNHFSSKEALFKAITVELVERLNRAVAAEFEPQRSLEDQLAEAALREVEVFLSPDFVRMAQLFIAEAMRSPELVRDAMGSAFGKENSFTPWVRGASQARALTVPDPDLAAQQLMALLQGPLYWPVVMGAYDAPPQNKRVAIVARAVKMFLDHYRVR